MPRPAQPRLQVFRGLGATGLRDLHYTEWGRRDAKRVIVCVHGYSGNGRDFDFLARALAADARVICLDVAGRGRSDWLASPLQYHFGQFLADIDSLISHLGVKEIEWVGTSMGGILGMLLASRPTNPIRRLVVNDIGAFVPMDALQQIGRGLHAPARFDSLDQVEAHLRRTHRDWGEITDEQYRHLATHQSRKLEGGGFAMHFDPKITRVVQPFPLAPGIFLWDAWYRIRCPVLLIRGESSEIFPRDVADTMLEIKPETRFLEVEGAGHAPSLMAPEQIEIVRDFLLVPSSSGASRGSRLRSDTEEPRAKAA
jgi:pimeloyl-ACP methyl ester carboxylesterase